jgi:MFS family permease
LPTYDRIGWWAALLLVVLRLAQGFGVGGEWGGAALMAVEHAPAEARGFYGSWPQIGVPVGLLLSTAVYVPLTRLPQEAFLSWGWRVPFLLSLLLVVVGLVIRLRILETPAFAALKEQRHEARTPVVEVLRRYPRQVLLVIGARVAENGAFYLYSVFALTYATAHVHMDRNVVLECIMLAAAIEIGLIPVFGALSDRVGRRPVFLFGAVGTAICAYPIFWLFDSGSRLLVWVAMMMGFTCHAAMYAPQSAFFSELFGTRVRYSGASLGTQLASVLAGGLSPFIATALLRRGYGRGALALYLIGLASITIVSVFLASETRETDIHDLQTQSL